MADGLVKMSDQFGGLPMDQLIGGPLKAACDSQVQLAKATADFIQNVGLETDSNGVMKARTVDFTTRSQSMTAAVGTQKLPISLTFLSWQS